LLRSAPSAKITVISESAGRGEQRGAKALHGARRDERARRGREPTGERREREQHQARDEQTTTAEQVGHAPAEQEKAAEEQGVGVDDPGQVVLGERELAADRRQCDVHDRRIKHDHELGQRQQRQRQVLLVLRKLLWGHLERLLGREAWGRNGI
jgi:hypothetical protein